MNTTVNIRIDNEVKEKSQAIFDELGLNLTSAITMFLKAVVRKNGIPFSLEIPNKETLESFEEANKISKGTVKAKKYSSTKDLRKDLGV